MQEAFHFLAPLLESPSHRAAFVERIHGVATSPDKIETLARLQPHHQRSALDLGFRKTYHAEQVHGAEIAVVTKSSPLLNAGADGLVTCQGQWVGR